MKSPLIIGGFFAMAVGFATPLPMLFWLGVASVLGGLFVKESPS